MDSISGVAEIEESDPEKELGLLMPHTISEWLERLVKVDASFAAVLAAGRIGSGIPAALPAKLFQPFVTTKQHRGTGLGLRVNNSIIERHGGAIQVRSRAEGKRTGTATILSTAIPPVMLSKPSIRTLPGALRPGL